MPMAMVIFYIYLFVEAKWRSNGQRLLQNQLNSKTLCCKSSNGEMQSGGGRFLQCIAKANEKTYNLWHTLTSYVLIFVWFFLTRKSRNPRRIYRERCKPHKERSQAQGLNLWPLQPIEGLNHNQRRFKALLTIKEKTSDLARAAYSNCVLQDKLPTRGNPWAGHNSGRQENGGKKK